MHASDSIASADSVRQTAADWIWRGAFALGGATAWLLELPTARAFDTYAFGDAGATMRLPGLTHQLGAPTQAYAYAYGILAHALAVAGLGLAGNSPRVFVGAGLLFQMALFLAMLWLGRGLGLPGRGLLFLLVTSPLWMLGPVVGLQYPLETILLVLGLGWQARGRLPAALACCAAAALFRPSLALVYGLVLLVALWRAQPVPRLRGWLRGLILPAATGGGVLAAAAFWYPPRALAAMLVPLHTAAFYRADGLGLLGRQGRVIWSPPGRHLAYYLGTPIGAWGTGLVLLLAAVIWAYTQRGVLPPPLRPYLGIAAGLFFIGFLFFYGRAPAYGFLLVSGLATLTTLRRGRLDALLLLFGATVLLGQYTMLRGFPAAWRQPADAALDGLRGPTGEAVEWRAVLSEAAHRNVLVLTPTGAPELVSPAVHGVQAWMLLPGLPLPREIDQFRQAVAAADVVVLPQLRNEPPGAPDWNLISAELGDFYPVRKGNYFVWLARQPAVAAAP